MAHSSALSRQKPSVLRDSELLSLLTTSAYLGDSRRQTRHPSSAIYIYVIQAAIDERHEEHDIQKQYASGSYKFRSYRFPFFFGFYAFFRWFSVVLFLYFFPSFMILTRLTKTKKSERLFPAT